jgi:hypothetical protein
VVSDGDFVSNDSSSVPQGNTPPPSRYNIELNPANDKPTITAAGSSLVVNSAITPVALPAITLADLDVAGGIGAGEQDFVQVTAEFLTAADAPFAAGVLSFSGALPAGVIVTNAAGDNTVVFQGSLADVQAALNQLRAATDGSDPDLANLKIKVTVDDRLRDASGALTAGANGGTTNTDGTPINATNNVASVVFAVSPRPTPTTRPSSPTRRRTRPSMRTSAARSPACPSPMWTPSPAPPTPSPLPPAPAATSISPAAARAPRPA